MTGTKEQSNPALGQQQLPDAPTWSLSSQVATSWKYPFQDAQPGLPAKQRTRETCSMTSRSMPRTMHMGGDAPGQAMASRTSWPAGKPTRSTTALTPCRSDHQHSRAAHCYASSTRPQPAREPTSARRTHDTTSPERHSDPTSNRDTGARAHSSRPLQEPVHRIVGYVDTTQILLHAIELSLSHGLRREHWGPVNNSNGITSSSSTKESKTAPQRPARLVLERLFHIESHQNEQDKATEPTEPLRT